MTIDPRTRHRPVELEALRREAQRLARSGLTPRDVAELLGIGTRAAAELLRPDFATTMPPPEVTAPSAKDAPRVMPSPTSPYRLHHPPPPKPPDLAGGPP